MRELFYPKSVAVIGVSEKPDNLGRNIIANLVEFGFGGIVYPVGPSGGFVQTHRIYRAVSDIPDHIDLAVILTPARSVPGILEECGQKGVRWVIIETAGFREYGEQGLLLEEQIVKVAKQYGIRFIGPNCVGVINIDNGFSVPFLRLKKPTETGDVTLISQSGGVGFSVLNLMANEGIALNKFVSVGNMLDVSAEDVLEFMLDDPGTRVIFVYLESLRDGRRLMDIACRSSKPILVFKSNIGKQGKVIAASHTAALSSDDRVAEAAFKQADIVRVHDATSLLNNLKALRLPAMRGKNLAIVSRSGGHAVVAADSSELSGFELARLPQAFLDSIEKHFRASVIKLTNPIDLGDLFDWDVYGQILDQTLQLDNVDGVVFLHTASEAEIVPSRKLLERVMDLVKRYDKPVAYYVSTSAQEVNYLRQTYAFPIFTAVVETIRALEMSYRYYSKMQEIRSAEQTPEFKVNGEAVRQLIHYANSEERDLLLSESMQALGYYGIPTAEGVHATSIEEARAAAEKMGYPVAIKVISEQISHKSDVGGVQLNLRNGPAVEEAFEDMLHRIHQSYPEAKIDGVLVQPMVTGGLELILGGRQDPNFGPVVLVGLGGIFVEVLEEVSLRVAPITPKEARDMINELRGAPILKGARGHKPSDIAAVVDALLRLSQLMSDFPEIRELDINPLRVFQENNGCRALDARIMLR
ncbi:MAG TPA: acetate--CoA ligase family protein [Anaerolineales bacterium]|nr:acetate--CoA ligase family protein [Anaerolineales bacterium]